MTLPRGQQESIVTLSYRDERVGNDYRWDCTGASWLATLARMHPNAVVAWDRDLATVAVMDSNPHVRLFIPRKDYRDQTRTLHGYVYWGPGRHHYRCSAAFATYDDGRFAWEIQPEIDGDLL